MSEGAKRYVSPTAIKWVGAIVVFIITATVPLLYIKSECQSYGPQKPISESVTVSSENTEPYRASGKEYGVTNFSFDTGLEGFERAKNSTQTTYYASEEPFDWWRHFLCEINGADYVLALFTLVLAASTILLWRGTERLAKGADDQSKTMTNSIALAREDFEATHRPWIHIVDITAPDGLKWEGGAARVSVRVICRNIGNSPAQRVTINVEMSDFMWGDETKIIIDRLKSSPWIAAVPNKMNRTIFPNQGDEEFLWSVAIPKSRFDYLASLVEGVRVPPATTAPVIVGTILYHFPFGDQQVHYTPFVRTLWRLEAGLRHTFPVNGEDVPESSIDLVPAVNIGEAT